VAAAYRLKEFQDPGDRTEVQQVEVYPRQAVLSLTRVRLHRRLRRRVVARRSLRRGHRHRSLRHHARQPEQKLHRPLTLAY
jgi:hypothetical protein